MQDKRKCLRAMNPHPPQNNNYKKSTMSTGQRRHIAFNASRLGCWPIGRDFEKPNAFINVVEIVKK